MPIHFILSCLVLVVTLHVHLHGDPQVYLFVLLALMELLLILFMVLEGKEVPDLSLYRVTGLAVGMGA